MDFRADLPMNHQLSGFGVVASKHFIDENSFLENLRELPLFLPDLPLDYL